MRKIITVVGVVLVAGLALGAQLRPATLQESSLYGATHVVSIKGADLTDTNLNTAQVISNVFTVAAGTRLTALFVRVATPFDSGATTNATHLYLNVGDASNSTRYVSSMELAKVQSPATFQAAAAATAVSAVSLNTNTLAMTVTSSAMPATLTYGPSTRILFTFTPNSAEAVHNFETGEVEVYFKRFP